MKQGDWRVVCDGGHPHWCDQTTTYVQPQLCCAKNRKSDFRCTQGFEQCQTRVDAWQALVPANSFRHAESIDDFVRIIWYGIL